MKIKCNSCGKKVDDSEELCPHCGAVIKKAKTKVSDHPKTINELKAWYEARHLPPYETTRFFIGINYTAPRAFGIYQYNDKFIVYKNKNDGSRSIRYEGPDEEYAVNELYQRLKQEIKNQKSNNKTKKDKAKKTILITFFSALALFFVSIFTSIFISERQEKINRNLPQQFSYYEVNGEIYYCDYPKGYDNHHDYDWWKYNEDIGDYTLLIQTYVDKKNPDNSFPYNLVGNKDDYYFLSKLYRDLYPNDVDEVGLNEFKRKYDIDHSKNYLDYQGRHSLFDDGYYQKDNRTFYHMVDHYTGDHNYRSGWYEYVDNNWMYYCDDYDYYSLGDDFWYYADDYYCGDSILDYQDGHYQGYANDSEFIPNEYVSNFEDTSYYEEYKTAKSLYDEEYEAERKERESSSFWSSSDNDYDWDSGSDSWDSGSTDFDSDW